MAYAVKVEEQIPNYSFPVIEQKVETSEGLIIPNSRAIVRGDTNEVLGVVKGAYKVLTHDQALDPILEELEKLGRNVFKKISLTHNGARMYANLYFKDMAQNMGGRDDIWPGMTVVNSLDGTRKYMTELNLFRLICTNGLRVPVTFAAFSAHHSKNANFEGAFEEILDFMGDPTTFDFINRWNQIPGPTKTDEEVLVEAITQVAETDGSKFPVRYADSVADYYKHKEDGITAWNFYNAFNSVIEHDIKRDKGRVERARELDGNLFQTFAKLYN